MAKKNNSGAFKYVYFGISFGTTMAVSIYFGFQGGIWLDNYFNTEPIFMLGGVLLGVAATFKNLLDNLQRLENKTRRYPKK